MEIFSRLGIVINYCSNERPFLVPLLEQCMNVTQNIVVVYGDKLYDGTPESEDVMIDYYRYKYPFIKFAEYTVDLDKKVDKMRGVVKRPTAYWCNLARWIGIKTFQMTTDIDWFLFLDADEIPDGERFQEWLIKNMLDKTHNYKLANYWYFKDPCFQAQTYEDSVLLVHKDQLTEDSVFHDDERDGILKVSGLPQKRMVMGMDNMPMFHHFSWVRGKKGITVKLRTWAHRDDIFKNVDIQQIVKYIYRNDDVNDCVHNYQYTKVANKFGIKID